MEGDAACDLICCLAVASRNFLVTARKKRARDHMQSFLTNFPFLYVFAKHICEGATSIYNTARVFVAVMI